MNLRARPLKFGHVGSLAPSPRLPQTCGLRRTEWARHPGKVQAGGAGTGRVHRRQNKAGSLLNASQGSGRQDRGGETVCEEVVVRGYSYRGSEGVGECMEFSLVW